MPTAPPRSPRRLAPLSALGCRFGEALRRFDAQSAPLSANDERRWRWLNLAARRQGGRCAHPHHNSCHFCHCGARAHRTGSAAGMSKQAMADLVNQCEAWGLRAASSDPLTPAASAARVVFTADGLACLRLRPWRRPKPSLPPWARRTRWSPRAEAYAVEARRRAPPGQGNPSQARPCAPKPAP